MWFLLLFGNICAPPVSCYVPPLSFFYAAPAKTRLSQWNPERHAVLSFRVERKQLLAVARQLQIWVITLPRPSTDPPSPPPPVSLSSEHKQTQLQLLYGMSLSVGGGYLNCWSEVVLTMGSAAPSSPHSCCQALTLTWKGSLHGRDAVTNQSGLCW